MPDTITLPITFIRRLARMRSAQIHLPESPLAREIEKIIDEDLKVIARILQVQEGELSIFQDRDSKHPTNILRIARSAENGKND